MKKVFVILLVVFNTAAHAQEEHADTDRVPLTWINTIQIGQLFANNAGLTTSLSASYMSGIQRKSLTLGVELGYNDYELFRVGSLALLGKYNLKKKGKSPYIYGMVGYGLPLYYESSSQIDATSGRGGLLTGSGVGVDFPLGKVSLILQIGYKFQKSSYKEPTYYYQYAWGSTSFAPGNTDYLLTTRKMHRLEVRIGLLF